MEFKEYYFLKLINEKIEKGGGENIFNTST